MLLNNFLTFLNNILNIFRPGWICFDVAAVISDMLKFEHFFK